MNEKFITAFDEKLNKYVVKKAHVVNTNDKKSTLVVDGRKICITNNNIFSDFNVALLVCKERGIKRVMKHQLISDLKDNNKTYWECPICKRKYTIKSLKKTLTVDHKIPLKNFMDENGEDIRYNKDLHNIAWNSKNLRLICKRCNRKKGHEDKYIINNIATKRVYNKCRKNEAGKQKKISFLLGKKCMLSDKTKMEIAKKDSRVFDISTINI